MSFVLGAIGFVLAALSAAASAYSAAAVVIGRHAYVLPARRPAQARPRSIPPRVALLKPLHGADGPLRQDLESFFKEARTTGAEVRMGLADPQDPARAVAEALQAAYPDVTSRLVVDAAVVGHNRKISNVLNLAREADAEVLVLADSDIEVPPGYLEAVLQTLAAPGTGVVTCAYYGRAGGGFWSRMAAMGLSYQFLPGVVAGVGLGMAKPCMGSTIALRRETLRAVGGFEAFRDVLADDYALGLAVRRLGLSSRLAPVLVAHSCTEATFAELFAHEVRWARTIRGLDPWGFGGSVVTHPTPLALAALAFLGARPETVGLLVLALAVRALVKRTVDAATIEPTGGFWLLPLRDIVSFLVFTGSFFGSAVEWRGAKFHVTPGGDLRPV